MEMLSRFFIATTSVVLLCYLKNVSATAMADTQDFESLINKVDIDAVARVALDQALTNLKLPDQHGTADKTEWSLSGIQSQGFTLPEKAVNLSAKQNGIVFSIRNLGIRLKADYKFKYSPGWIIKISNDGKVDVGLNDISARIEINIYGASTSQARVAVAACTAAIGDVNLKFSGSWLSSVINLFKASLQKHAQDMLSPQICQMITKTVNERGTEALKQLQDLLK